MLPLLKIINSQKKKHCHTIQNAATPSGNYAMKFSAKVSDAHAAVRLKGPGAADDGNKACTETFQHLLSNSPWTQKIVFFPLFSQQSSDNLKTRCPRRERACSFCFLAWGSTLANWLTVDRASLERNKGLEKKERKKIVTMTYGGKLRTSKSKSMRQFRTDVRNREHCFAIFPPRTHYSK